MIDIIRIFTWETSLKNQDLKVNVGKTKVLVSSPVAGKSVLQKENYPSDVFNRGVDVNSIMCSECKHWIHEKSSDLTGSLKNRNSSKC